MHVWFCVLAASVSPQILQFVASALSGYVAERMYFRLKLKYTITAIVWLELD